MLRTGTEANSLVKMLKGAVNLGVFGFSLFPTFAFLGFEVALGLGLASQCEGLEATIDRPLRVYRATSSLSDADLGVGGELENIAWLFC